jgi:hypothetical protein
MSDLKNYSGTFFSLIDKTNKDFIKITGGAD